MHLEVREQLIVSHSRMLRLAMNDEDNEYTHNESTTSRMEKGDSGEDSRVASLKRHGVFQDGSGTLGNIINKDVVTPVSQESLLRLSEYPDSHKHLDLKLPVQTNMVK
ncbi:hypothetical protein LSH36_1028g00004 [Paralvinella palmiformis]|uniref:Uncharacterized protein n=1 Tax=Paralvinella palmiformis TaxID=53620 RepID=A0AAD9IVS9_9ANNE|nr:hypothetical protein LSH36_1028g00004 [Paralvinella palmiformis]